MLWNIVNIIKQEFPKNRETRKGFTPWGFCLYKQKTVNNKNTIFQTVLLFCIYSELWSISQLPSTELGNFRQERNAIGSATQKVRRGKNAVCTTGRYRGGNKKGRPGQESNRTQPESFTYQIHSRNTSRMRTS